MLAMPMNTETAHALCDITSAFYRDNAASFSSTRHGAWAGWERALDQAGFTPDMPPSRVLDVACGNMRFLDFLEKRYPGIPFDYRAVDNCPALAEGGAPADARLGSSLASALLPSNASGESASATDAGGCAPRRATGEPASSSATRSTQGSKCASRAADEPTCAEGAERGEALCVDSSTAAPKNASTVRFTALDIAGALFGEDSQAALAAAFRNGSLADLAVCFGFFHHVPTTAARETLLRALVRGVRPGGGVVVSLWQFANSPDLVQRARETDARARAELGLPQLDAGDYLIGWQNKPGAYRYCHSFTEQEADALAASVEGEAETVARFEADGRTGNLNAYLVLRRVSLPVRNDLEPTGKAARVRLHAYKGS